MLRADTLPASRLADVIAQVDRAAFQRAEQRLAMELFRCGLSFDAPVTDAHFYEDVRPCGPDFIFNAATLFGYSEPAIYSLLSGRIKSLCADRLDVSFGYIGESLSDDARWRTYRQCRCRWRRMQIILEVCGDGAWNIIGLLEKLGIKALGDLQSSGLDAGCGREHPEFSNRSPGGEGVVRGVTRYFLYIVTDDKGPRPPPLCPLIPVARPSARVQ